MTLHTITTRVHPVAGIVRELTANPSPIDDVLRVGCLAALRWQMTTATESSGMAETRATSSGRTRRPARGRGAAMVGKHGRGVVRTLSTVCVGATLIAGGWSSSTALASMGSVAPGGAAPSGPMFLRASRNRPSPGFPVRPQQRGAGLHLRPARHRPERPPGRPRPARPLPQLRLTAAQRTESRASGAGPLGAGSMPSPSRDRRASVTMRITERPPMARTRWRRGSQAMRRSTLVVVLLVAGMPPDAGIRRDRRAVGRVGAGVDCRRVPGSVERRDSGAGHRPARPKDHPGPDRGRGHRRERRPRHDGGRRDRPLRPLGRVDRGLGRRRRSQARRPRRRLRGWRPPR